MKQPTCALWYWRYHSPYYELCATEMEAVGYAMYLEDYGEGSVTGIQYDDGRIVGRDDWTALTEAQEAESKRWADEARRRKENPTPPPPTRTIRHPFDDSRNISVLVEEPEWLGL